MLGTDVMGREACFRGSFVVLGIWGGEASRVDLKVGRQVRVSRVSGSCQRSIGIGVECSRL